MASMQQILQYMASNNDINQIQKTMLLLGEDIEINEASLFDDNNNVIASTSIGSVGHHADDVLKIEIINKLKQDYPALKRNLKNSIWQSADKRSLYAISPIVLGREENESLRADKFGIILLDYDMQWVETEIQEMLNQSSFPMMIMLSIAGLCIAIYFNISISRRIQDVNKYAAELSGGNYSARISITGNDEITDLGLAFNAVAQKISEHTQELIYKEKKLKSSQVTLANSKAKFRGVLESAIDGVLMVDGKGKITLANQALCDLTGYLVDDLIGETIEKLVPTSFSNHKHLREEYFKDPLTRAMGAGMNLYACRKNGTYFPVEVSLTPVEIGQEKVVAAIVQDVTERKKIEHDKEELLESLEEKNAELERFTYTVSHDLKSPLVTMTGFIGLLEKDIADNNKEKITADFIRISDAANTMQDLLNDLLELSRIGRQDVARVDVSLENIISTVLEMSSANIDASHVEITVETDLPVIHVVEARFKEVYLNLIENAIKYRRDDVVPKISIGVRRDQKDSNEIVFFVKDNGVGIDGRYQEKIFGLFERLSNDNKGTGVGLAIVKRIIELHNGRIWVESDGLGHGSTFNIVISQKDSKQAGGYDDYTTQ